MENQKFNLITCESGAILKCTEDFEENDPYICVREGDDNIAAKIVGDFFNNFLLDSVWNDGPETLTKEFEVEISIKRIR